MKEKVISKLCELTGHESVKITARCNASLFYALFIVRKFNNKAVVAIPDQGGWLTYKKYPGLLGFRVVEYPTKDGIVDVDYLKKNVDKFACIIVENPAGYAAEQPMDEVFEVCDGKTLVIEDVSGSLGSYCGKSHIKVGSFGKWKPLDAGLGGFISTSNEYMNAIKDIFTTTRIEAEVFNRINQKLNTLNERYTKLYDICEAIKKDLIQFDVVHRNKKGLVVIVRYKTDDEKQYLMEYCNTKNYPFTDCPRYIRLMDKAICIEVKRL